MSKGKGKKRRWHWPRHKRRRHAPKIPLIPLIGLGAGTLAGSSGGWTSPIQGIMDGQPMIALQTGIRNLTGLQVGLPDTGFTQGFQFDIAKTLNPFDMTEAVGLKGLFWGSVISAAMRAFGVNRRFTAATKKVPFIKKFSL